MRNRLKLLQLSICLHTFLTIFIALVIGLVLLNPLWAEFSPPFPIPKVLPAITAPVDGPFYLQNAQYGYHWDPNDSLSLWFHPFMSYLIKPMPNWFTINIWFWLTSIMFAIGCIILTTQLISILGKFEAKLVRLVPLILLAPGGLEIATGNAEIPTLFFTLILLLSVLRWQKWWLTGLCAILAILTKPNALYMIPVLSVYFISGVLERNKKLWIQAFLGIIGILATWFIWIWFVDWNTRTPGAYWHLRILTSQYAAQNVQGFLDHLARSFLYDENIRDQIRYSTALIIPIANMWVICLIPLSRERDRLAMFAGSLTMLFIALDMGNPNKIIVYTTTLPGYFATHILFIEKLLTKSSFSNSFWHFTAFFAYTIYCIAMLIVYILGTPLGWYY